MLDEFDVAGLGILDALGTAELVRPGKLGTIAIVDEALDFELLLVGKLVTVGTE